MPVKPRVLIFSLAYFPVVGGAEIAVKEITDRLGGSFDFDLITLRFNTNHLQKEKIGHINVFRIEGSKLFFPITSAFLARKLHRQNQYKISWPIMAAYTGFGALLFKFLYPKVPMLLTLQEGDSEKHILKRVGIFYPLWKLIFKKADYIQVISNYLADFARKYGAVCPVEVVPNGVDISKFQITKPKLQINSKTQNPNVKTIITTSRLVYKNGIDILIRAIEKLQVTLRQAQCPESGRGTSYPTSLRLRGISKLQIFIVGDGPDRSKLEQLAKDLDVADQIKFIGHVDPDLIPNYLYQADVFIRPSRSEGLGSSFLEAMAAGLPVIGTAVGGIPDFLVNNINGLFCKIDDPDDLAEKVIKILNDSELSHKLSENGRKTVEENYSWDSISVSMKQIMEKLPQKKLLLVTGIYPPEIGGPATYAALLEKELPKYGVDVTVLPFRIVKNWPVGIRHLFYFFKAVRLCRGHDFILAQDTISVGLPSVLAAKLLGKWFLIRVPGDYVWEQSVQRFGVKDSIDDFQKNKYCFKVELLRSVQKFVVGSADTVITPSSYFRDLVRGWVKNKDKVITIYNGIEISDTKSHVLHRDDKTIVSVGRLVPWKGFDMVIEMMQDLPGWTLAIIGDGPEREALELQVTSFKLQDRVKLTGAIPREKVLEYLGQADIFVLNTSFESFSFQIVEAMSLGLPVIATNIGNLAEIIETGVDGLLVEPNNKRQFLDAIEKLENDEDFRKSISERAKIKAERFSIENTVKEVVSLLT